MPTVVLGVTGCIGAYKACEVLRELQRRDVDVHVVMTEHATRFVGAMTFEALSRHPVFVDQFEMADAGMVVVAQQQAGAVGPVVPGGFARRAREQAAAGDDQDSFGEA